MVKSDWQVLEQWTEELPPETFVDWIIDRDIQGDLTTQCAGVNIFGGFELFGQSLNIERIFENLPEHTQIRYSFDLWIIDNWDFVDQFFVEIDNEVINTVDVIGRPLQGLCGSFDFDDAIVTVRSQHIPHESDSLEFSCRDNFQQPNDKFWGISSLIIEIYVTDEEPQTPDTAPPSEPDGEDDGEQKMTEVDGETPDGETDQKPYTDGEDKLTDGEQVPTEETQKSQPGTDGETEKDGETGDGEQDPGIEVTEGPTDEIQKSQPDTDGETDKDGEDIKDGETGDGEDGEQKPGIEVTDEPTDEIQKSQPDTDVETDKDGETDMDGEADKDGEMDKDGEDGEEQPDIEVTDGPTDEIQKSQPETDGETEMDGEDIKDGETGDGEDGEQKPGIEVTDEPTDEIQKSQPETDGETDKDGETDGEIVDGESDIEISEKTPIVPTQDGETDEIQPTEKPTDGEQPMTEQPETDGEQPMTVMPETDGEQPMTEQPDTDGEQPMTVMPETDGEQPMTEQPDTDGEQPMTVMPETDGEQPMTVMPETDGEQLMTVIPETDGEQPMTVMPETDGEQPMTEQPDTDGEQPMTVIPETDGEVTEMPMTEEPKTDGEQPITDKPDTQEPVTDGEDPITDKPETQQPVTDGEDSITDQQPSTEKPLTEEPATDGEMPDGEDVLFCINNKCFNTPDELQKCVDVLENLDTSEANNTSIQNDCVPYISTGNRQMFFFSINYTEGFQVDGDCLDTKIFYEGQEFVDGEDFTFDKDRQFFKFDIPLQDFDDKYKCERLDTEENIVWKCKIKHSILLGDEEQVDYSYKIQVTLDKLTTGTGLYVNIIRQEIEGFCCENQLQVQTALEFCSDFECSETLESPIQVKRQAEFIVRHFIVSPEFKFFYLLSPQINLDRITPTIVDSRSDVGEHVLKVKSPVAGKNFNVTVISRLSSTPAQTSLRRLQYQGEVGDEYRVRADGQISIVGDNIQIESELDQEQSPEQQTIIINKKVSGEDSNGLLIGVIIGISVVFIGATVTGIYIYKKNRNTY